MLSRAIYRSADRVRTWRQYARARAWSWSGVSVGRRVKIASECRIERPWGVSIGDRASLEHAVWLKLVDDEARVAIGAWTFVGAGTEIDVMRRVFVGEHVLIAPGCFITDHNHAIAADRRIDQQPCDCAPVWIGSDVWLGAKVTVLPGVTIGDGAVAAAGAVVRDDVPPMTIVAGVPSRPVGRRK